MILLVQQVRGISCDGNMGNPSSQKAATGSAISNALSIFEYEESIYLWQYHVNMNDATSNGNIQRSTCFDTRA